MGHTVGNFRLKGPQTDPHHKFRRRHLPDPVDDIFYDLHIFRIIQICPPVHPAVKKLAQQVIVAAMELHAVVTGLICPSGCFYEIPFDLLDLLHRKLPPMALPSLKDQGIIAGTYGILCFRHHPGVVDL